MPRNMPPRFIAHCLHAFYRGTFVEVTEMSALMLMLAAAPRRASCLTRE